MVCWVFLYLAVLVEPNFDPLGKEADSEASDTSVTTKWREGCEQLPNLEVSYRTKRIFWTAHYPWPARNISGDSAPTTTDALRCTWRRFLWLAAKRLIGRTHESADVLEVTMNR